MFSRYYFGEDFGRWELLIMALVLFILFGHKLPPLMRSLAHFIIPGP